MVVTTGRALSEMGNLRAAKLKTIDASTLERSESGEATTRAKN
jgi:hypothetical protein